MNITTLANLFVKATHPIMEQDVADFMTGFLREHSTLLVFSTKQVTEEMWREWLSSLPSQQMYSVPQKIAHAHAMYEAIVDYLISNPTVFHYSSSHGWRADRKRFFQEQADIITV